MKLSEYIKEDTKFHLENKNKNIIYQSNHGKRRKFQLDNIFCENENNSQTFNKIKNDILKILKTDKNLFFLTFGQEKLGK